MNVTSETYTAGIEDVTWYIAWPPTGAPVSRSLFARLRRATGAFMREWRR